MSGKAVDLMCNTQAASLSTEEMDDCQANMPKLLLFDSLTGFAIELYFAYVLYRYSQEPIEDDDFEQQ